MTTVADLAEQNAALLARLHDATNVLDLIVADLEAAERANATLRVELTEAKSALKLAAIGDA